MKPINAMIECDSCTSLCPRKAFHLLPPIASLFGSPLLRHLAAIQIRHAGGWTSLNNESLNLLSQYASNLTSLGCALTLTPSEPLVFPAKLQSLNLQLDGEYTDATINGVLGTVAALPSLSHLRLALSAFALESAIELRILAACRSLTDLHLSTSYGSGANLNKSIRFARISDICIASVPGV